jgi:hypothetical protein
MLRQNEIDEIVPILSLVLTAGGSVNRSFLTNTIVADRFPAELAAQAPPSATADELALAAIRICMAHAWLGFPDARTSMERLLSAIDARQGVGGIPPLASLAAIVTRLKNGEDVLEPVWRANWLLNDEPLVDRAPLREQLRDFAAGGRASRPILRIEGDGTKIGKSHSLELMHYASQEYGTFRVVRLRLDEGQEAFYTSVTLAEEIVGLFDTLPVGLESPVKKYNLDPQAPRKEHLPALSNWVITAANRSGVRWWLVLDKFSAAAPQSLARELIELLADNIANNGGSRSLRLVLIDYGTTLQRVNEKIRVAFDRPNPAEIGPGEIKSALAAYCNRVNKPRPDDELQKRAEAIFQALPSDETRLIQLNGLLLPAAQELTA